MLSARNAWAHQSRDHYGGGTHGLLFQRLGGGGIRTGSAVPSAVTAGAYPSPARSLGSSHLSAAPRSFSQVDRPSTSHLRRDSASFASYHPSQRQQQQQQQHYSRPGTGYHQRLTIRRRFSASTIPSTGNSLTRLDGGSSFRPRRLTLPQNLSHAPATRFIERNEDTSWDVEEVAVEQSLSNSRSRGKTWEVGSSGRPSSTFYDERPPSPNIHGRSENRGLAPPMSLLDHGLEMGVAAKQGRRPYMEDEYCMVPSLENANKHSRSDGGFCYQQEVTHFFGVFDGHAGGRCSKALAQSLPSGVSLEPCFDHDIETAIKRGFLKVNADFMRRADRLQANDGSTAITAFFRGRNLWIANVGDSRAVMVSNSHTHGGALALSTDHKPNRPEERRRIVEAGGKVMYIFGIPRVNGILAVSRAFGDRNMQGTIDAEPEITHHYLTRDDTFLILATDGVWDTISSQQAASLVTLNAGSGAQACADLLVSTALKKGSLDNATAMVIDLRKVWSRGSLGEFGSSNTATQQRSSRRGSGDLGAQTATRTLSSSFSFQRRRRSLNM